MCSENALNSFICSLNPSLLVLSKSATAPLILCNCPVKLLSLSSDKAFLIEFNPSVVSFLLLLIVSLTSSNLSIISFAPDSSEATCLLNTGLSSLKHIEKKKFQK